MKLTALRPMLRTHQLEETLAFYTGILGFTLAARNDEWGWASLYKDNVAIMVATPNHHMPFDRSAFTGSFYFNTDNVDELWERVKDKTTICYGIENFEWQMREFAIYDNNGYMLQFGQDITPQ